jgi:hypothetical protein
MDRICNRPRRLTCLVGTHGVRPRRLTCPPSYDARTMASVMLTTWAQLCALLLGSSSLVWSRLPWCLPLWLAGMLQYWTLRHHFLTSQADWLHLYKKIYGTFPLHSVYYNPQLLHQKAHRTSILWNMLSDANSLFAMSCASSITADNILMWQQSWNFSMCRDWSYLPIFSNNASEHHGMTQLNILSFFSIDQVIIRYALDGSDS